MPIIRPVSDLRNKTPEIEEICIKPEFPHKISVDSRFTETDLKHLKLSAFHAFSVTSSYNFFVEFTSCIRYNLRIQEVNQYGFVWKISRRYPR